MITYTYKGIFAEILKLSASCFYSYNQLPVHSTEIIGETLQYSLPGARAEFELWIRHF